MTRRVLFVEVPDFYATIERADTPELAARPVIVGGDPRKRGTVLAASSDARAAGVVVDMPMLEALRLCPRARRVPTDMRRYREVSRRLFARLRRAFGPLEPLGLGAAYLDAPGGGEAPEAIGEQICGLLQEELQLPARLGVASGKFLARLAAEEADAGGVGRIAPGAEADFLRPLTLTRLEGVGDKTAAALSELGARTIGDVAALPRERLEARLGTHGLRIQAFARGLDDRPVRAVAHPRTLSREVTVETEALDLDVLAGHLPALAQELEGELALQGLATSRVALKLRFGDQGSASRSQTLAAPTRSAAELQRVAAALLGRSQAGSRPVRALGIQLSGLAPAGAPDRQLDLFLSTP